MIYAAPNKPVTPVSDPYRMFAKLYGRVQQRDNLVSVLDDLKEELRAVRSQLSLEEGRLFTASEEHDRPVYARLPLAPRNASPVPHLTSQ
jgi:hypothetical protein